MLFPPLARVRHRPHEAPTRNCWCPPPSLRHASLVPALRPTTFPTRTRLDPPINRSPVRRLRPPSPASRLSLCIRFCWPIYSLPQSGVVRSMSFSVATDHIEHSDASRAVLTTVDNRKRFCQCREEGGRRAGGGGKRSGKGERSRERRVSVDSPGSPPNISRPPPSLSTISSHRTCLSLSSVNLLLMFGSREVHPAQIIQKVWLPILGVRNLCSWHKILSREVALSNAPLLPLCQNPGSVRIDHGLATKPRRNHMGQPTQKKLNGRCIIENEVRKMFGSVSRWRVQLSQHGQLLEHWTRPSEKKHILPMTQVPRQ